MNMRSLGNIVSKRPVMTLIVILIVTAIFGLYASQIQMNADLKTFLPNDDMVKAEEKVSDEFGDTDYVEVVFKSNNALNKSTLLDMLNVESALENNSLVKKNLKTPDNPSQSFMSPADVIVMGNMTLSFEKELITVLKNVSAIAKNMNFTLILMPVKTMNQIMANYEDIYSNASDIRKDAENLTLMLFIKPNGNNLQEEKVAMGIMQNVSYVLTISNDFGIKSKVLTILTPPLSQNASYGNQTGNPLMNYFLEDMNSTMPLYNKSISAHYFREMNNYSYYSLNYTNSSLTGGIEETKNLMDSLNATKASILAGDNKTALNILNQTIYGVSQKINYMESLLPYYTSYNASLSKFLYDFTNHSVSYEDIKSVEENTSQMIKITSGDFQKSLMIFNETFINWTKNSYIFYDTVYEANSTRNSCEGFIDSYYQNVMLNYSLTDIKMQINHNSTTNTTIRINYLITNLNSNRMQMEEELGMVENTLQGFETPYFRWFQGMLWDMEYVILNSNVGDYAVNVFNLAMEMQKNASNESAPSGNIAVFYSIKHAFDSSIADKFKYEIQDIFLREMTIMNMPTFNFTVPSSNGIPAPDFNPTIEKRRMMINNMSQEEIEKTIKDIENYNSSKLINTLNESMPVIGNLSKNMSVMSSEMSTLVRNIQFVYNTTLNFSVQKLLVFYENMMENVSNATERFSQMNSYLPQITGFSYMMDQLSGNIKSMFSNDFNGRSAKAAMMIVMLNSTYLPDETTNQHSDRMERMEEKVENIATRNAKSDVMVMGTYLVNQATEKTSNETMNVLLPVAMILVVIILLITFRSILDTLWGLLGLGMAILWAYGFGVMMGYSFNQVSTTVAVLLVGLGIDYAIHTILRYREELRKGRQVRDAMNEMITHLGMGLVLATITTMVAFLSNITSPIPPIQNFGVMNAVGIFGAFVIFTTAIPAIKILVDEHMEKEGKLKVKKEERRVGSGIVVLNKFMSLGAAGAEHHRYTVITVIGLITLGAIFAGLNVGTTFDIKDFLPSNLPISNTIQFMMDNFNTSGMNDNYVLIEGNITSGNTIKAVKMAMENMKDDDYIDLTQSQSITTYIDEWKEKNTTFAKMVNGNDTDHDGYPDKNITSIYNWLYEHGDAKNILHKSDGKYDSMLITVRSTASTDVENKKLYNEMEEDIKPLKVQGLTTTITGTNLLTYHILDLLQSSEWNSLIVTIIASLIVLVPVFYYESRSWVLGAITTLPVVIAMLWLVGTMYLLGINFNVMTVTTTSLTIGLGITYSIHITHRFLEDMKNEKRIEDAIRKTVRHTGTAIFGAATTTMAGFGTLMLSSMPPIRQFGEIATLSILYSFILAVFILPSFLYVWAERRKGEEE